VIGGYVQASKRAGLADAIVRNDPLSQTGGNPDGYQTFVEINSQGNVQ
jgi:hypothetical protein